VRAIIIVMNTEEQNQVDNTDVELIEENPEALSVESEFNWKLLSLTLVAFIVGASFVAAAFYYKEQQKIQPPVDLTPEEAEMVWTPPQEDVNDWDLPEDDFDNKSATSTEEEIEEEDVRPTPWDFYNSSSSVPQYDLSVEWKDRPEKIDNEDLPIQYVTRAYLVGVVQNGVFAGESVHLLYTAEMGEYPFGLFVFNPEITNIEPWLDSVLKLPDSLSSTDGTLQLKKDGELYAAFVDIEERRSYSSSSIETLTFDGLSGIPDNTLYTYSECLFARTPSDLLTEYIIDVPFIEDEDEGSYSTPEISYNRVDGDRVTGEYEIYDRVSYGCGSLCSPLKVVDRSDDEFVKTGVTDDGSDLYVLKDVYDERYNELYTQRNTRAFVDTSEGQYNALDENKYEYEAFINIVPLLYWKDPLGRWVEFVNTEFIILAEKCKPVIYLYPEEETDLHVEVEPNIGFTKTIPEYKSGWDVTAYPDGTVIDRETGDNYDYLYWAGLVDGYPLIEEGWVVAQKDLPAFFDYSLPLYGLQGEEITDFTEYWIDDMNEAPYYAVSFVEQSIIDELSPLSIDKEPDVVVRVLMTAMPLNRPIKLHVPQLPEIPERRGFTVIEWGGTILR
jgi:hypothetical protein